MGLSAPPPPPQASQRREGPQNPAGAWLLWPGGCPEADNGDGDGSRPLRTAAPRPKTRTGPEGGGEGKGLRRGWGPAAATHRALLGHHLVQPPGDLHDLLLPSHRSTAAGTGRGGGQGPGMRWGEAGGGGGAPLPTSAPVPQCGEGGRRAGHAGICSPRGCRPASSPACGCVRGDYNSQHAPLKAGRGARGALGVVVLPASAG